MSNKMICPVCGAGEVLAFPDGTFACDNEYCKMYDESDTSTYDLLIQYLKDFEIARKALEKIVSDYEVGASSGWLAANAKQALEQIEHKEK